jgi:hypothetical protein
VIAPRTLLACSAAAVALGAAAPRPRFTSADTETGGKACKTLVDGGEGGDPVLGCPGVGPYRVTVWFAAFGQTAEIADDAGFKMTVASSRVGGKLEWRLADGVPFAVIAREVQSDETVPETVIAERLVVRGLRGYEGIGIDVDAKTAKNVNVTARAKADDAYVEVKAAAAQDAPATPAAKAAPAPQATPADKAAKPAKGASP